MKEFLKRHKYLLGFFVLVLAYVCVTSVLVVFISHIDGNEPIAGTYLRNVAGWAREVLDISLFRMHCLVRIFGCRPPSFVFALLLITIVTALLVGHAVWIATKRVTHALLWCVVVFVSANVILTDFLLLVVCLGMRHWQS